MMKYTNDIVEIEPNRLLKVLVSKFYNVPKQVVRNQTIEIVLPNYWLVVPTQISTADQLMK